MVDADDTDIATPAGASLEVIAARDDEPRWQASTVPVSLHALNSGSHLPEWIEGMLSASGFSE